MSGPLRVLLVEDSEDDALLVLRVLRTGGYEPESQRVDTPEAMRAALADGAWDIVISDYLMPKFSGPAALKLLQAGGLDLPLIIVSGTIGEEVAVATMQAGAVDYLLKDRLTRLPAAVRHALAKAKEHRRLRQAETRLRESEELFRTAMNSSPIGLALVAPDGRWLRVNPALCRLLGYSEEELLATDFQTITHPDDLTDDLNFVRRMLRREIATYQMEKRYLHKDGTVIWVLLSVSLMWNPDGTPRHFISQILNITERKLADLALRKSEANLLAAQAIARIGSSQYNPATGEWIWSPQQFRIFRLDPARGVPPRDQLLSLVHPDYRDAFLRLYSLDHPAVGRSEFRFQLSDGSTLWTEQSNELIYDPEGRLVSIIGTSLDITERKRMEEALTLAHRRASVLAQLGRKLAEAATPRISALAILEAADQLIGWESSWLQLWKEEKQEFESSVNFDLIDGERREVPSNPAALRNPGPAVRRTMREGAYLHLRANEADGIEGENIFGAPRRALSRMFVSIRRDGRLLGVLSIQSYQSNAYDPAALELLQTLPDHCAGALARIQTRVALELAEARYRRVVDNISDALMVDDAAGRVVYANQRFLELFGLSPDVLPDLQIDYYVAPEYRAELRERHNRRMAGEEVPDHFEYEGMCKNGTRRWLEARVTKVMENGMIVGSQSAIRDITERKTAEARIRELVEILDRAPVAVVISDLTHRSIYWNKGAEQLLGRKAADAINHTAEELNPPETLERLLPGRAATFEKGEWHGEVPFFPPDGRRLIAELSMSLIRDDAGQPRARLIIGVDITERKEAEERLLRVQRLENLGMLAAGIAHDFNNALAPLVMGCPLLRPRVHDPGGQRLLDTMEKSAGRSVKLVHQLLSFARGAAGESQLLQVRHVLDEVLELAKATFPKSIRLTSHLPGELWPVQGNPSQIHQIFLNLFVNARDAMPQGGTLTVTAANTTLDNTAAAGIADARPGSFLVVEVNDTGTGIPPDALARIWEPFFSTKGEGKGTGLGLSTVRGILKQSGGFATVKTGAGHGTAFAIYLPAVVDAAGADTASAHPALARRGAGELILVVDDEEAVSELAATILINHGYRALTAQDGTEAIAVFATHLAEVKLLLTDLQMPILGGAALAGALHRMKPSLPVVAMSGAGSQSSAAHKEFTTAFLAKPFQAETLLSIVRRTLDAPPPNGTGPQSG